MISFKAPKSLILQLYNPLRICLHLHGQSCLNPKEEEKSSRGYAASFEEQLPFLLHLPTLGSMTLPRWEKQSVDGQSFTQLIRMKREKEMILGDN